MRRRRAIGALAGWLALWATMTALPAGAAVPVGAAVPGEAVVSPRLRLATQVGLSSAVAVAPLAFRAGSDGALPALAFGSVAVGAVVGLASPATLTDAEAGLLGSASLLGAMTGAAVSGYDKHLLAAGPALTLFGFVAGTIALDRAEVTPSRVLLADLSSLIGAGVAASVAARARASPGWIVAGANLGWIGGFLLVPDPPPALLQARPALAGGFLGTLGGASVVVLASPRVRGETFLLGTATGAAFGGLIGWLVGVYHSGASGGGSS